MDFTQPLATLQAEQKKLANELELATQSGQHEKIRSLGKRYAEVQDVIAWIERSIHVERAITEARPAAEDPSDPELQAMAAEELATLTTEQQSIHREIMEALHPSDPNDRKDVIVEIRAGAGGDEAALFAGQLFRMYARYAEQQSWKTNLISSSPTGIGGLKEVIFEITGTNVFRAMKFESGVHRVQRVPDTEKNGRVHTSTVTVAVVPMAEETELVIDPKDLKIIASTSSGAGGQSVNTTYSAIRLTHIPTGITVSMQDERSQTQNRIKAMQVLRSRLLAKEEEERRQRNSDLRKGQIGTGDRSEKIRTYNFPQDRITDHRIKVNVHNIANYLDGQIGELVAQLQQADQQARAEQS